MSDRLADDVNAAFSEANRLRSEVERLREIDDARTVLVDSAQSEAAALRAALAAAEARATAAEAEAERYRGLANEAGDALLEERTGHETYCKAAQERAVRAEGQVAELREAVTMAELQLKTVARALAGDRDYGTTQLMAERGAEYMARALATHPPVAPLPGEPAATPRPPEMQPLPDDKCHCDRDQRRRCNAVTHDGKWLCDYCEGGHMDAATTTPKEGTP
jgi:hypothetical protein